METFSNGLKTAQFKHELSAHKLFFFSNTTCYECHSNQGLMKTKLFIQRGKHE